MKEIPKQFMKGKTRYYQIKREKKKVMYELYDNDMLLGFEVARVLKDYSQNKERYPAESEYGRSVWFFRDKEKALSRYMQMGTAQTVKFEIRRTLVCEQKK